MIRKLSGIVLITVFGFWSANAFSQSLDALIKDFKATEAEVAAGAVAIRHQTKLSIINSDKWEASTYVAIAILDDQAASDYSTIRIEYNSFYDNLELKTARLISPDGTEYRVSEDAIQVKTGGNGFNYDDIRTLTFTLPAISPGSFLEYEYVVSVKQPVIKGHWYQAFLLNFIHTTPSKIRVDPVRKAWFLLDIPAKQTLRMRGTASKFLIKDQLKKGKRFLQWEQNNLAGMDLEENIAEYSNYFTWLELSNIFSWSVIDNWASSIFRTSAKPTAEITKIVDLIVTPDMSSEQKIKAIFYWVQQKVRYISADFKRGGVIPHLASDVLKNRYGDCKDQSVLLIAMLRAAGIDADPVLISPVPRRKPSSEVPLVSFNHMIVRTTLNGRDIWLDTSGDAGKFPGIDVALQGQRAFVINAQGGKLADIPLSRSDENNIAIESTIFPDGDDLKAKVSVVAKGAFDHRFKINLRSDSSYEKALEDNLSRIYGNADRLENFSLKNKKEADALLTLSGDFIIEGAWEKRDTLSCAGDLTQVLGLFSHLVELSSDPRMFDFDPGVSSSYQLTVLCTSPGELYKPILLSNNQTIENEYFNYRRTVEETIDGIMVTQKFVLNGGIVKAKDYLNFVTKIRDTIKNSEWLVGFKQDKSYLEQSRLKKALQKDNNDQVARIALARKYMEKAEFEKAHELINKVVKVQPENAEAQYLRGLILGFLDEFEASEKALEKAGELGYSP